MMLIVLLLIPLGGAGLSMLLPARKTKELVHAAAALLTLSTGLTVAALIWSDDELTALDGFLRADALSALLIVVITLVGAIAALFAIGYLRAEYGDTQPARVRLFYGLFHIFTFTMLLAVSTDNLGVMWVAIEGTTLATVFLVNLHQTRTSLEA